MELARARIAERDVPSAVPIPTGLVVLLPSASACPIPPDTVLGGLPLVRRIVLAAERAGIGWIAVMTRDEAEVRRLVADTRAMIWSWDAPPPTCPASRVVLLPSNVVPQSQWLRSVLDSPLDRDRLYVEGFSVALVETDAPHRLLSSAHGRTIPELLTALAMACPAVPRTFHQKGRFVMGGSSDIRRAEDWLLRSLIKDTEGFMSRHVERRISLAVSRRLARTRLTPNAMTLISVAVGLIGAPFFLSSSSVWQLTGALLFLLHSILDGCDGELARLKFMESRWGGILDFWGDNVVHVAVFLCMAGGWMAADRSIWPMMLGATAVAGSLLSAGFVYWYTMRANVTSGPLFTSVSRRAESLLSRMADALARRDFIYLVVLLAAFGKAHWFVALAGVGAPLFFLVLVWMASAESGSKEKST